MHTLTRRNSRFVVLVGLLAALVAPILLSGCGNKEEPPPAGTNYYSGPRAPKGGGGGKPAVQ